MVGGYHRFDSEIGFTVVVALPSGGLSAASTVALNKLVESGLTPVIRRFKTRKEAAEAPRLLAEVQLPKEKTAEKDINQPTSDCPGNVSPESDRIRQEIDRKIAGDFHQ